jgi:hypothetical protein
MEVYPNLAADLSTLTQINRRKYLRTVLNDERLHGRLMYGTDYPLTNTPLVTPWQYPLNLTLRQLWDLGRIRNSWDRDVRLKAALGVRPEVFTLSREYLGRSLASEDEFGYSSADSHAFNLLILAVPTLFFQMNELHLGGGRRSILKTPCPAWQRRHSFFVASLDDNPFVAA